VNDKELSEKVKFLLLLENEIETKKKEVEQLEKKLNIEET